MVKLTPELILQAQQRINPIKEYELNLRGYKINVIENLGATLDQFDTLDFSDNEIRKLDGFPLLNRLKTLLLSNNRICRIGENLQENLPKLESLVLSNNQMAELGDIDSLSTIKTLRQLSLTRNPIVNKKQYRLYIIHKLPQLKVLDFQKIHLKEKTESRKIFGGKAGEKVKEELVKRTKTFTPGAPIDGATSNRPTVPITPSDREAIKKAIASASSLEEVERLTQMLKAGHIPGKNLRGLRQMNGNAMEVEDDDDDM